MRLYIAVIFVLLFCTTSFAQNHLCSEIFSSGRHMKGLQIIGHNDKTFFVTDVSTKDRYVRLTAYSIAELNQLWSQQYPLMDGEEFETIEFVRDQFMLFISQNDTEREQHQVYCITLDENGNKKSESTLVHHVLSVNKSSTPEFGIEFSPDSTKILVYFDPPYERKSTEALSFKCYTTGLELLWEKEMLLPYTQEIVQVHSFLLDNEGDIYMMSGRNPSKNGRQWQKPQGARYVVFYYNSKNNKLKEYDISLKDKQMMSVIFSLNTNQDVMITGYYSNDFHFSAAGTIFFSIGANGGSVKTASFMPFSLDFLSEFMRKSDAEKFASLPDLFLDHMVLNEDGSMLLIGEQYYASENTITDPTTGRQTIEYRYNFDDVIVTSIDKNGRHLWNTKVPKRQYTTSDTRNCSYQCFWAKGELYIYFNDDEENTEKFSATNDSNASLWSGSKSSITSQIKVKSDGTSTRITLFSNKQKDSLLNVYYGLHSITGPQLLGYEDGSSFRFCTIH